MQNILKDGYTREQIVNQLHFKHGSNEIKFRYELLDKFEKRKFTLKNVIDGSISMAAFGEVKRTAQFKIAEGENVDWLNDRIQPFFMLKMNDDKWIEWSLGIFIMSSPNRVEEQGRIFREIEAYDGLIILKDAKFLTRYLITEGTRYTDAINTLLVAQGLSKINIENNEAVLKKDKEFEPGGEILGAINELLKELNYTTLWVDEMGYYTANRYTSPTDRPSEYDYFDDEISILSSGVKEDLDLFNIANSWVVVASNPEEVPLVSSYINDSIESLTSKINRGRIIADYREIESIANQTALDEYVKRLAFNSSQIFGYVEFETALNPLHSYSDVYNLRYGDMNIDTKYSETNWTMPLKAGEKQVHSARKVVNI